MMPPCSTREIHPRQPMLWWLGLWILVVGCGLDAPQTVPTLPDQPIEPLDIPASQLFGTPDTATTGLAAGPDPGPQSPNPGPSLTIYEGSDSAVTPSGTEPPATIKQDLQRVGQLHLGYDFRSDQATVLAELEPLVSPGLYSLLAVPLPAALEQSLVDRQVVIEAEPTSFEVVQADVYRIVYTVTQFSGGAHNDTETPGAGSVSVTTKALIASTDEKGIVVDIR